MQSHPYSEEAISIGESSRNKADDVPRCYSADEIETDISSSASEEDYYPANTELATPHHLLQHQRSRSVVLSLNKSRSHDTYASARNRKRAALETLSRDDLQSVYVKERKHRLRQMKKYKQLSVQFQETLTKNADDYEDELQQNEDDMKQEYETKLIEAEIQRNASDLKINELSQEVQRLKQLLTELIPNQPTPHDSVISTHSPLSCLSSARPTPRAISVDNRGTPVAVASTHTNITPITAITPSFSFAMERKEMNPMMSEGLPPLRKNDSMGRKLRMTMVPVDPEQYAGSFTQDGVYFEESNEGTEDDKDGDIEEERDAQNKGGESPKYKKKKKKRKKKNSKRQYSFWEDLIECITPSACDDETTHCNKTI